MAVRDRLTYGWIRSWPLLIAAVITFVAGTRLLTDVNDRELAAAALLVVGAICVGAWITMLAAHDYPGREPTEEEKDSDGQP